RKSDRSAWRRGTANRPRPNRGAARGLAEVQLIRRCTAYLFRLARDPRRAAAFVLLLALAAVAAAPGGPQLWGYHHLRAARRARAGCRRAGASAPLERSWQVWPDDAAPHLLAAQAARRAGDFDAAERHLEQHQRLFEGTSQEGVLEYALLRAQN